MHPEGRSARAVVDGVSLAYDECGEGPPIVLIHGLASCAASWATVASRLSRGFRVISLDLMGFGRSDKPTGESYTLERQAKLLRLFLADRALVDAVLVGHSYGGGVCLTALRDVGLPVRGLVLVDTICYPQPLPLSLQVLRLPLLGPLALFLAPKRWLTGAAFGSAYGGRAAPPRHLVAANARALASTPGRQALVQTVRALTSQASQPPAAYSQLAFPTLILWGRRDRLVSVQLGERLASEIPGARLVVFDACGHLPQEEAPGETAEAISRFISTLGEMEKRRP